jgi:hypothetical protein
MKFLFDGLARFFLAPPRQEEARHANRGKRSQKKRTESSPEEEAQKREASPQQQGT